MVSVQSSVKKIGQLGAEEPRAKAVVEGQSVATGRGNRGAELTTLPNASACASCSSRSAIPWSFALGRLFFFRRLLILAILQFPAPL
jgi:hypothetical protein